MPLPTHANCKFISCKDSRSWLEHRAEVFGEQSPMSGAIYLPYGRRSEYYYLYVFERTHVDHGALSHLDNKPADQKTFHVRLENGMLLDPISIPHVNVCRLCLLQTAPEFAFINQSGKRCHYASFETPFIMHSSLLNGLLMRNSWNSVVAPTTLNGN